MRWFSSTVRHLIAPFMAQVALLLMSFPGPIFGDHTPALVGDADGNGVVDHRDAHFLRSHVEHHGPTPASPDSLSDVATPCGRLDDADVFLVDRAARHASQRASRSQPVRSPCHGTIVGTPPPDPHADAASIATLDDLFLAIASEVPEFAGLYFDRGVPTVALTTPSATVLDRAVDRVVAVFGAERFEGEAPFRAAAADFGFEVLHEARQQARGLLAKPEVATLDIDERRNRLVVGTHDAASAEYVAHLLANEAISTDLAVIETSTYEPQVDLKATVRPLRAGRRVLTNQLSYCTMGPIVDLFGKRGWLTNSHCTP